MATTATTNINAPIMAATGINALQAVPAPSVPVCTDYDDKEDDDRPEPLSPEEREEYEASGDDPAVYVSTYHKYNNGSLAGMWINLAAFSDSDELHEFLRRLHADEKEPEFMIQDFENIPKAFYGESGCDWGKIYEWLELDEDERQMCLEYWDEVDSGAKDMQDIIDRMVYEGDANDYYDELADEMISCISGSETLKLYFNYEAWRRDCGFDYHETEHYVFSAY